MTASLFCLAPALLLARVDLARAAGPGTMPAPSYDASANGESTLCQGSSAPMPRRGLIR